MEDQDNNMKHYLRQLKITQLSLDKQAQERADEAHQQRVADWINCTKHWSYHSYNDEYELADSSFTNLPYIEEAWEVLIKKHFGLQMVSYRWECKEGCPFEVDSSHDCNKRLFFRFMDFMDFMD
jgi:hypothetical protein